jgi:hypothetical protein
MSALHGVIVGCDESQEWLLNWWWKNYVEENSLPVAFADFGMSDSAKEWCKERGTLVPLSFKGLQVATRDQVDPSLRTEWEKALSPFWGSRQAWFKKPFALLNTPFPRSIWLDLDCEVLGPLEPIFKFIDPKSKMGLVRARHEAPIVYNSGVIVFENDSPLLTLWAESALCQNDQFLSDQDALSQIILDGGYEVGEVPEIYNWLMCRGVHIGAVICHWAAQWGKAYIRQHGGIRDC